MNENRFPCRIPMLQRLLMSAAFGACFAVPAVAMPTGPIVTAGQVTFTTQGNLLTIASSAGAIINWQSFSIAQDEVVRYVGSSSASSVLNLVTGGNPTIINGTLQSNGEVALITPNGVTVGGAGTIDTAGLSITSTQVSLGGNVSIGANAPVQVTAPILSNLTVGALTIAHLTAPNQNLITLTSGNVAFAPTLESGWNLLGNSLSVPIDVAATFGGQDAPVAGVTENLPSVWKWIPGTSKWAFYSPQLTAAANASFAAGNGFDLLSTINPKEGFWVSVQAPFAMPPQVGSTVDLGSADFSALAPGFNLVAIGGQKTPAEFNDSVGSSGSGGPMHANFTSLWAWDVAQQKWLFHSPVLQFSGGLSAVKNYAGARGYLHFPDRNKTLGIGVGFWVDK